MRKNPDVDLRKNKEYLKFGTVIDLLIYEALIRRRLI